MSIANRTYKDLAFSMFANPMSGDMGKKTGASAVKQAIVAILKRIIMNVYLTQSLGQIFVDLCLSK